MRLPRRSVAAVAVVVLVALTVSICPAGPAAAASQSIGNCTTTSGVILAVDFSHWGGPIVRACGTIPTTGYALLNEGGFHTTGDNHDGPAFICRIGYSGFHSGAGYPTAAQDACIVTPPASAYWSYWHADPGQNSWSYSQLGAMSYQPEPGSVDLWIFGGTNIAGTTGSAVPTYSPDALLARNTGPLGGTSARTPAASPTHTAAPAGQHTRATNADHGSPPHTGASAAGTSSANGSAASDGSPGGSGASDVTSTGDGSMPPIENADPPTTKPHVNHGSATPAIITFVIVLAIGAAGAVVAIGRRPHRDI